MYSKKTVMITAVLLALLKPSESIWCYRCNSATPGCGDDFNWRGIGYLGDSCPEDDDICVKVVEKKGAFETITRDCLSALQAFRTDIPADKYEGCRPATTDVALGHYVNTSIKELDIKRNHFTSTTFCFCFLDHRCNDASVPVGAWKTVAIVIGATILSQRLF